MKFAQNSNRPFLHSRCRDVTSLKKSVSLVPIFACRFVFYEVRPASCGDVEALDKFAVRGVSRWRKVTQLLRLRSNDTTATTQEKDELLVGQRELITFQISRLSVSF